VILIRPKIKVKPDARKKRTAPKLRPLRVWIQKDRRLI